MPKKHQQARKKEEDEEMADADDVEIDDEDDDEYDPEGDSEDRDFIAADEEAEQELMEAKSRQLKEARKEKKKKKKDAKKNKRMLEQEGELEDEDLDLIAENRGQNAKKRLQKVAIDDAQDQIDTGNQRGDIRARLKRDEGDFSMANMASRLDPDLIGKREASTTAHEAETKDEREQKTLGALQSWNDKFVTDEIDDYLFCTQQDQQIEQNDVPERLQLKLDGRFNPKPEELQDEAVWIFNNIIENLEGSKNDFQASRIKTIQEKITQTLRYFRCDMKDVPYVTQHYQHLLMPDLQPSDVWRIFNLDIEYGKFISQKKQVEDFLKNVSALLSDQDSTQQELENYIQQVYYAKDQRDLRDYDMLIDFYKSFFQKELETLAASRDDKGDKKLPGQRRHFVSQARAQRLDQFARRWLLRPQLFVENIESGKLQHKPCPPENVKIRDLIKEYLLPGEDDPEGDKKRSERFVQDSLNYAAVELWCQPGIRKFFKNHVREHGTITTEPTDKGVKDLDLLHASYRVKRVNKRIAELENSDLFLDIVQNEQLGLIKYTIEVQSVQEFFDRMFELFDGGSEQATTEIEKKWQLARADIKRIFINEPNPMLANSSKAQNKRSFVDCIIDEIKEELREDAEAFVINKCKEKYTSLIQMGYFKIGGDGFQPKPNDGARTDIVQDVHLIEDEFIQQRERLCVMGAILYPLDNKNFQTMIAIVNKEGELVYTKEFYHLMPPRKFKQPEGPPGQGGQAGFQEQRRPGEIEEQENHEKNRNQLLEILREHQVDLVVVSADCLQARYLKKVLSEIAELKKGFINGVDDEQNNFDENGDNGDADQGNNKEVQVIWGRSEIPKLFASSHLCNKLLKNCPFVLKKAIGLARFEQDPMNEVLNLWSPIISENQALNLNLHPLQKHINKARLMDTLEIVNIQVLNNIGVDINQLIEHEHCYNQLQFLSGLGPRKAQKLIQRIKKRNGRPIATRADFFDEQLLQKYCFYSAIGFVKVRIPPEKRSMTMDCAINLLDQTRIHPADYGQMERIAVFCIYGNEDFSKVDESKRAEAVRELFRNSDKLRDVSQSDLKDHLQTNALKGTSFESVQQQSHNVDVIIREFLSPFKDPREDKEIARRLDENQFSSTELFYCLIDETEQTFKRGMVVSATIIRVFQAIDDKQARIAARLENGLDATINQNDADFFGSVQKGSIVQGRVFQIKFGQTGKDDNFSVTLKCKQNDLKRLDMYVGEFDQVPEEDLINRNFEEQEEAKQMIQKKLQIMKRKIQHARFQNISSVVAVKNLQREDNGEFYFRPSSRGTNHLTLTWKFFETNLVHIDIEEFDKAVGANIGSRLKISSEFYENLQEIVERYITPCNRSLREVTMHPKFSKCTKMEQMQEMLLKEKSEDSSKIPYRFTILDDYPQYLILAYIPKKEMVREFIKVKPRGFFFHQQYQYPFQNLINWFKKSFKTRDYQSHLRRAVSPQRITAGVPRPMPVPALRPSGEDPDGMQVDQTNENGFGFKRENRGGDESKGKASGWGADAEMDSGAKSDRRPPRGGGDGRGCFKCGKEGHFARECPEAGEDGGGGRRGPGGGGGGRACFRCGEEGHIARDCPQPREDDGGRPPFQKRQRRDDDGGGFGRGGNDEPAWKSSGGGDNAGWNNNSQPDRNDSGGGGGWGDNGGGGGFDARSSENKTPADGGGWGAKDEASQGSGGGGGW